MNTCIRFAMLAVLATATIGNLSAAPLGTAITYQGELRQSGNPSNGQFDFRLRLYDAPTGGSLVGPQLTSDDVSVTGGTFALELDFGTSPIADRQHWLQIEVRPGASTGSYTLLSPRQKVTAAPQALFALGAAEAGSIAMANLRTVGVSGGQFATVAAALASISAPSASNPYLVLVGPGIYNEAGPLNVPGYVHVRGMGKGSTVIRASNTAASPVPNAAVFSLANQARLSNLRIEHTGSGAYGIGVYGNEGASRSTRIEDVEIVAAGSGTARYAVYLYDSEPHISRATLRASGATTVNAAVGSVNNTGGFPQALIENSHLYGAEASDLTCSNATGTGFAFQGTSSSPLIRDSYLCGGHRAIYLGSNGNVRIQDSHVATSSTTGAFLLETTGTAVVQIAGSLVEYVGNKFTCSGNLTCVHSYKSNNTPASNGSTPATSCN